ncbi:glycerate kinase [Persephonella atlantica]|uniref:Glycerate kinase n=1 Tax=Persephonella atlantica TaxID=2699429 RepID=A0ABS1GGE8_9AQUI|nr:glycerate kinase [Persephonella atlantica]MBK3331827.1 glycerate kinase [Persephonella atlantica]
MNTKAFLTELFLTGIEAVKPENLIPEHLSVNGKFLTINGKNFSVEKGFYLFGSGKASIQMAKSVEKLLGDYIKEGIVVCNYTEKLKKTEVIKGSHPVPDENSVKGAEILLQKLSSLKEDDFFIYLLSGGSSALIEKPIPPITLKDLKQTTQLLLENSVPIEEINIVRKHLSMIKGGRLGRATKAKGVVLVISDVVGDDLFTIGSAPLYYDPSTYQQARDILKKYNLWKKIPATVKDVIRQGIEGKIPETPKKENPNIKHYIIGNNLTALKKIKQKAEKKFPTFIMTSQIKGEAREVAKVLISIAKEIKNSGNPFKTPVLLLFGGETTVTVRGKGKGGRNQELCLSALQEIKDTKGITILSGGTDGIDGNSDAAGAVVDWNTSAIAKELNLDINQYLSNNDSYSFFSKTDSLIKTGYTGTNVMDITIIMVEG